MYFYRVHAVIRQSSALILVLITMVIMQVSALHLNMHLRIGSLLQVKLFINR